MVLSDIRKALKSVVHDLQSFGVEDVEAYIYRLLFFDTVFHNKDRHTNNYSFLMSKDGTIKPAPLFDFGMAFGANTHTLFDPPKLFFQSSQDVLTFLNKEHGSCGWTVWGIPECLTFSQSDLQSLFDEAAEYYRKNELDAVKFSLCQTVLDFPDFFPNLDAESISKL